MTNELRDIIIITGQSGIKINDCIGRLASNGFQFQVFAVDQMISQLSGEDFVDVLGKPPRIQELLWTRAFKSLTQKLPARIEKDKYTFLTFHACYFHQRKTEFISPVNFDELSKLKDGIKMVIIFIDDCYDIYRRLIDNDQMYSDVLELPPLDSLLQSVTNISNLLIWREIEIAFSRKIAQLLNVPMYSIAVKHPTFMVSRLIGKAQTELNTLYLSHPISAIRKQGMHERLPAFYTELNGFIQEVVKYENMVLFIPDTIDEYRIKTDIDSGNNIPELMTGWPIPFPDQWLCGHLPVHLQEVNPLNPKNFSFSKADGGTQSAISSALNMLSSRIVAQINARDRTLVEQSVNGILVFRPYWAASVPSGVEQEMKYNYDLKDQYEENERKAFLLSASQDLGKWRIRSLFTLFEDSSNIDGENRKRLELLMQKWLGDNGKVLAFFNISYDRDEIRKEIEAILTASYDFDKRLVGSPRGALAVGKMLQKAELLDKGWEEILNQIDVTDPLLRYAEEDCVLCSDVRDFPGNASTFIRDVIVG